MTDVEIQILRNQSSLLGHILDQNPESPRYREIMENYVKSGELLRQGLRAKAAKGA